MGDFAVYNSLLKIVLWIVISFKYHWYTKNHRCWFSPLILSKHIWYQHLPKGYWTAVFYLGDLNPFGWPQTEKNSYILVTVANLFIIANCHFLGISLVLGTSVLYSCTNYSICRISSLQILNIMKKALIFYKKKINNKNEIYFNPTFKILKYIN